MLIEKSLNVSILCVHCMKKMQIHIPLDISLSHNFMLVFLWLWTDLCHPTACYATVSMTLLFLSPMCTDGRCADVRCCACGGRGCAAVSADHCQLITVQPTQAVALWEPLHGPHQRGGCSPSYLLICLVFISGYCIGKWNLWKKKIIYYIIFFLHAHLHYESGHTQTITQQCLNQ